MHNPAASAPARDALAAPKRHRALLPPTALARGHAAAVALPLALAAADDRALLAGCAVCKTLRQAIDEAPELRRRAAAARAASHKRLVLERERERRRAQLQLLEHAIRERSASEVTHGSCMGCLDVLPDGYRSQGWSRCGDCRFGELLGAGDEYGDFCEMCYDADALGSTVVGELWEKLVEKELTAQQSGSGFQPTFRFSHAARRMAMASITMAAALMLRIPVLAGHAASVCPS